MKKLLFLLFIFLFFCSTLEAKQWFVQDSVANLKDMYTGGASGAGTYVAFVDGDSCLVITTTLFASMYVWDSDSGATGDDVWVVAPTYSAPDTPYTGNGRWRLVSWSGNINALAGTTAGGWYALEIGGTDYRGWEVPDSITNSWVIKMTDTDPAAYSIMQFAAPSSDEVAQTWIPNLVHRTFTFDPAVVCAGAVDSYKLFTVGNDAPNGIIIRSWRVSFEADPSTEFTATNLCRATAFIGKGSAAIMDAITTTNGAASESTYTNINSGSTVANGQCIYLDFTSPYTEENHQVIFEIWYNVIGS